MIIRRQVHAHEKWHDSTVDVRKGDRIAIRATGKWIDWWQPAGPKGFEKPLLKPVNWTRRARHANWFELVAVIGRYDGPYWRYSQGSPMTAARDGRLYLFANDASFMYWNNKEHLDVEIEVLG